MPLSPLGFMDALGNIYRALVDSSRRVVIAGDPTAPGVPVTLTPQPFPVAANADKLFGWGGEVQQNTVISAAAGNNNITGAAVPAGKVWVIDSMHVQDFTNAPTAATFIIVPIGGSATDLNMRTTAVTGSAWGLSGKWVAGPGTAFRAFVEGCTLNDNVQFRIHGYSMNST